MTLGTKHMDSAHILLETAWAKIALKIPQIPSETPSRIPISVHLRPKWIIQKWNQTDMPTDPSRASNAFITICSAIDTYSLNLPEKYIQWHLSVYGILPLLSTKRNRNMRQNKYKQQTLPLTYDLCRNPSLVFPILLEATRRKVI